MSDKTNFEYFAERALFERAMSRTATDRRAIAAHIEMAERYEALASEFKTKGADLRATGG